MCLFYTNELYTHTKPFYPKMCFLLSTALCKSCFSLMYFFDLIIIFWVKENKLNQNCCHHFVMSFYIFSYLVAIKEFLIFEMFWCCRVFLPFLPSVSLTLEESWMTEEPDCIEAPVIDSH